MRKGQRHSPETIEKMRAAQQARRADHDDNEVAQDATRPPPDPTAAPPFTPPTRPDPPPKGERKTKNTRQRVHTKKPSDEQLSHTLGKMFTLPAVPAKMVLHCDFCTDHFTTEGPKTAVELVALSKEHPALRGTLEDLHRAYTSVTWIGIIGGYLARPLAHHLAPDALLVAAEPVLGVPPRNRPAKQSTPPTSAPTNGGIDLTILNDLPPEEVASTARDMGYSPEMLKLVAEQMGWDTDTILDAYAAADQADHQAVPPFTAAEPYASPGTGVEPA